MKAKRKSDGAIIEVYPVSDNQYLHGVNLYQASNLDFDVEEGTEEVTIEGWVARNHEPEHEHDLHLFTSEPMRRQIMGDWYGHGQTTLDTSLYPNVTWENSPLPVTITIKAKKK